MLLDKQYIHTSQDHIFFLLNHSISFYFLIWRPLTECSSLWPPRRRMPLKRLQSGLLVLAVLVLFDVKGLKGDGCRKRVLVLFGGKGFSNVSTFLRITLGHFRREATSTDCCQFELKKKLARLSLLGTDFSRHVHFQLYIPTVREILPD